MIFGTISLSTPFVGVFLLLIVLGWIIATQSLGKQFHRLTSEHQELNIEENIPTSIGESPHCHTSAKPT